MSETLPTVLPLNGNAASNPAALGSTPQNQQVGAQNIFANLLVAQFKERGLMLDGLAALNLDQVVQPLQELPEGGKPLPVELPVADALMQLLQTGDSQEALPVTMAAANNGPVAANMLDMALRSAINSAAANRPAATAPGAADTEALFTSTSESRQNAVISGNELRAHLNDSALLAQMTGDTKQSTIGPGAIVFDPLPDLLAQKLAAKLSASTPAVSSVGGQSGTSIFSQLAGVSQSMTTQIPAQSVFVPIDHADWGSELGDRVRWLVTQNIQTADIRLNPPELGPVRVHISIDQAQVSVTFTSHHSVVREALQSAMANLGDLLAESGLNLAQGNVADQSPGQQHEAENEESANFHLGSGDEPLAGDATAGATGSMRMIAGLGLVDQYV